MYAVFLTGITFLDRFFVQYWMIVLFPFFICNIHWFDTFWFLCNVYKCVFEQRNLWDPHKRLQHRVCLVLLKRSLAPYSEEAFDAHISRTSSSVQSVPVQCFYADLELLKIFMEKSEKRNVRLVLFQRFVGLNLQFSEKSDRRRFFRLLVQIFSYIFLEQ